MTSPDRSWMYKRFIGGYLNNEFVAGVKEFLKFAEKHSVNKDGQKLKCPCNLKKCRNVRYLEINEIHYHLYKYGFEPNYYTWKYHGEGHIANTSRPNFSSVLVPPHSEEPSRNVTDMVQDEAGPDFNMGGAKSPNDVAHSLLEAGKKPLYPGCEEHTLLSFVSRLMNIKAENNISRKCYDQLTELIKELLPKENLVPGNFFESKMLLRGIDLPVEKIDYCKNNCMIYSGDEDSHNGGLKSAIRQSKYLEKGLSRSPHLNEMFCKLHEEPDGLQMSYDIVKTKKGALGIGSYEKTVASRLSSSCSVNFPSPHKIDEMRNKLLEELQIEIDQKRAIEMEHMKKIQEDMDRMQALMRQFAGQGGQPQHPPNP